MDRRLIVIAASVVLGGTVGGYTLGGYATGAETAATAQDGWFSSEASAADTPAAPEVAALSPDSPPEHYICHGCGPTLAERRASSDSLDYPSADIAYQDDLPPLPPEKPESGDARFNLPDLDPGRAPR